MFSNNGCKDCFQLHYLGTSQAWDLENNATFAKERDGRSFLGSFCGGFWPANRVGHGQQVLLEH
jgi:hypothetical protein